MNPNDKTSQIKEFFTIIALGICVGALIVTGMLMFPREAPTPSVQYGVNDTTEIATKLQAYFKEAESATNDEDCFFSDTNDILDGGAKGEVVYATEDALPTSPNGAATDSTTGSASELDQEYVETTDNQVDGVVEADKIKRSDKYIYYLSNKTIQIFDINKEETKKVGEFTPKSAGLARKNDICEFYLSKDCKSINMIVQYNDKTHGTCFDIVNIDVSNPAEIKENKTISVKGSYNSSRFTDNQLLIISEFVVVEDDVDYKDESTFVPQINIDGEMKSIDCAEIVVPENLTSTRYVVIMNLNPNTLEVYGRKALLSHITDVYATKDHLYLAKIDSSKADSKSFKTVTEIQCFEYSTKEIKNIGSVTVDGYIKDQWSMDEYEGILRVVTTTNTFEDKKSSWYDDSGLDYNLMRAWGDCNANLYCIDIKTWETVGSVLQFAPPHEEVQSVRFDQTDAYVCTSIEMSDPVFFFDLKDVKNITYKETGTIEGYSSSLVNFGDGYLLGIGVVNWSDLKIEVYTEGKDDVESVCAYTLEDTVYSEDYKSYFIDRENQLVGLGIESHDIREYDVNLIISDDEMTTKPSTKPKKQIEYIILQFNKKNLNEIIRTNLDGEINNMRGVYIDGYMYMFADNEFKVQKIA